MNRQPRVRTLSVKAAALKDADKGDGSGRKRPASGSSAALKPPKEKKSAYMF